MSMNDSRKIEEGQAGFLRVAQIIVGALAFGVVAFMVVAFLVSGGLKPLRTELTISVLMAIISIALLVARLIVPALTTRNECQKIGRRTKSSSPPGSPETSAHDQEKLLGAYLSRTIVAAAILEAAAFLNLVAFFMEGQVYSLLLAGFMIFCILAGFPTRGRLASWLVDKTRLLDEIRSLPRSQ